MCESASALGLCTQRGLHPAVTVLEKRRDNDERFRIENGGEGLLRCRFVYIEDAANVITRICGSASLRQELPLAARAIFLQEPRQQCSIHLMDDENESGLGFAFPESLRSLL